MKLIRSKDSNCKNIQTVETENIPMSSQNSNLSKNLSSIKKSNWLLSLITVAVAFAVVPLLPILLAFVAGHWISKQNK